MKFFSINKKKLDEIVSVTFLTMVCAYKFRTIMFIRLKLQIKLIFHFQIVQRIY